MTRPLVVLALAVVALGGTASVLAQEPEIAPPVRLTLAEALERAKASSPRMEQLRALQLAADASLRGAKAGRWPLLDLEGTYRRNSNVPEFSLDLPGGVSQKIFLNIADRYRAHLNVSLPVYTGGRVSSEIDAKSGELAAAGKDVAAGMSDLVLETITAYWELVTAIEAERVLSESIAAYEADLKQASDRFDVGMAARNDVLSVQVERDQAELSRLDARNGAAVANENLLLLLGLAPGSRVEPTEPVAAPGEPEEALPALVEKALAARPEVASLRARVAAAEARIGVARSARRPRASIEGGYDYASPNVLVNPITDDWHDTWNLGVSVSWRAFDGGRTSAAIAEAEARADAERRQLQELERRVRLEVASRAHDLRTRRAAIAVAERNLEAARENVRVARDRLREGLIPSSELLDAQSRLLRAGLDSTRANTGLRQARASLDRAVGR